MSRSVNPVEWLKILYRNFANIRRLALKTAIFTFKLSSWAFIRVYVGLIVLLVLMRQKLMKGKTQQAAAAASDMSERSVRNWNKGPLPSDWSCTIESGHTSPWAIYRTPAQVFAEERSIRCLPDQASTLSSREAVSDFTAGVSLNLATSLS